MKPNESIMRGIEGLFMEYEKEVRELGEKGILSEQTAITYLTHAWNFVRWCRDDFEPGAMKKRELSGG